MNIFTMKRGEQYASRAYSLFFKDRIAIFIAILQTAIITIFYMRIQNNLESFIAMPAMQRTILYTLPLVLIYLCSWIISLYYYQFSRGNASYKDAIKKIMSPHAIVAIIMTLLLYIIIHNIPFGELIGIIIMPSLAAILCAIAYKNYSLFYAFKDSFKFVKTARDSLVVLWIIFGLMAWILGFLLTLLTNFGYLEQGIWPHIINIISIGIGVMTSIMLLIAIGLVYADYSREQLAAPQE